MVIEYRGAKLYVEVSPRGSLPSGLLHRARSALEGANQRIYEVMTNPAYIGAGVNGRKQYYFKDNVDRDVKHHKKQ